MYQPNALAHLGRNSVPILIDGTIFYANESPLQTQQVPYNCNSFLNTDLVTNYHQSASSASLVSSQLSYTPNQTEFINFYYSPPSTSTSIPSTSHSISVNQNQPSYNTLRARNLTKNLSVSPRSIHANLKVKSRRRTPISFKAIHSLCLCSFSHRFPHTIEQHHRLKLDNLASIDSTSFLGAHLISTMGQKVSTPFSNKPLTSVIRESSTCTSTLTPIHQSTDSLHNTSRNSSQFQRPEPERPSRLDLLLDLPPVSEQIQKDYGWNEDDRSLNIFVLEDDPRVVHRHPVAQSTDCVRGRVGYKSGLHVWEIKWPLRQRGTHAVVGVATSEAALHTNGYQPLVGSTPDSWGWDLGRNVLYHDLKPSGNDPYYTYGRVYEHQFAYNFVAPETILTILDMDEGTLSFMANGQYLGVAFRGLKGKILYPIISSVWGHCEITMRYINGLKCEYSILNFP